MIIHKHINDIDAIEQNAGKGVALKVLLSTSESPNFAMRNFTIKPGGYMPLHTNTIEHEQYVLSGCAKVKLGDYTTTAKAGDIFLIPAGIEHSYETIGDEPYSFLCCVPNKEDKIEISKD